MKDDDINLNNTLLDEKSYENILVCKILYKNNMDAKPLFMPIRSSKLEGIIKIYGRIRYLELFNLCDVINDRIDFRYYALLIGLIIL